MSSACRIAIYSQDSLGLGHLRRTTVIGRMLLESRPDSNVLLLMDSPAGPFCQLPEGMDHLKLPSIRKVSAGRWESIRLRISTPDLLKWRTTLLHDALMHFRPDVFLVDHMPGGALGELHPALEALKEARPGCAVILGLRDILDAPEVTMRVWEKEGAYQALEQYYDQILVYGCRDVFDTGATYRLPVPSRGIHYCGYVVNSAPVQTDSEIIQRSRGASRRLVYVSSGGGHDGALLTRTYLRAVRLLGRQVDFASLIATGVHAPPEARRELEAEAQDLPVYLVSHVMDGMSAMAASDLVVCMAGYNSMCEVLYLRKKALVVPRAGPSAEQRMRARLLAGRGLIDMVDPRDLSADKLAERLLADLERKDYPPCDLAIGMCGAERAAGYVLGLVDHPVYAAAI